MPAASVSPMPSATSASSAPSPPSGERVCSTNAASAASCCCTSTAIAASACATPARRGPRVGAPGAAGLSVVARHRRGVAAAALPLPCALVGCALLTTALAAHCHGAVGRGAASSPRACSRAGLQPGTPQAVCCTHGHRGGRPAGVGCAPHAAGTPPLQPVTRAARRTGVVGGARRRRDGSARRGACRARPRRPRPRRPARAHRLRARCRWSRTGPRPTGRPGPPHWRWSAQSASRPAPPTRLWGRRASDLKSGVSGGALARGAARVPRRRPAGRRGARASSAVARGVALDVYG